jgi:hypothetical protein
VERANGLILAGLKPILYEELEDYGSKWIEELPKVEPQVFIFLPSLRIRSSVTNKLDMDITEDRAI